MSMYLKLTDDTTVTLTQARYTRGSTQDVVSSHEPLTHRNSALRLGLTLQEWTVTGWIADPTSVRWQDIAAISLDNTTWRTAYYTGCDYPSNLNGLAKYELHLLVAALAEGAVTRYPTTGYKWGDASITGISQAGNANARPELHYLGPLFYAPLTADLVDFTGEGLAFTRSAAKIHSGVSYGVNVPIFDSGLYIGSDTASDTPVWTPPTATIRTVALQLKQTRYPTTWAIGATGGNLLTANQSNIETDTTGLAGTGGTLTRDTVSPMAGTAHAKLVSTGSNDLVLSTGTTAATVTAGRWYCVQTLVKCTVAAGRQIQIGIIWQTSAGAAISTTWKAAQACPATATLLSLVALAPATAAKAFLTVKIVSSINAEVLYADSLMLEELPTTLTVWTATKNKLTVDLATDTLKWTDDTTTISATFPTSDYMAGTLVDAVVIDDTSHAATVAAHPAGGSWTSGTGTLAAIDWPELTLGPLQGSISNLICYEYALTSTEYQALDYSMSPLRWNDLFIALHYPGEVTKDANGRLLAADGSDITGIVGGTDIDIGATAVTIQQTEGLAARWYVNVRRTDT